MLPWLVGDMTPGATAPPADLPCCRRRSERAGSLHPHRGGDLAHRRWPGHQGDAAARQGRWSWRSASAAASARCRPWRANYGLHLADERGQGHRRRAGARPTAGRCEFWQPRPVGRDAGGHRPGAEQPGRPHSAGRITYVYPPDYLGGSLLCVLPSGRLPDLPGDPLRRASRMLDDDDQPHRQRLDQELRFARGYGRVNAVAGAVCENVVQAVAADCPARHPGAARGRRGFARARCTPTTRSWWRCPQQQASVTAAALREVMQRGFDWSEGLPLMSEETIGYALHQATKCEPTAYERPNRHPDRRRDSRDMLTTP